ncbi:MAG: hypothetical protein PHV13_03935 [Candidatus ainarchaeum sp.]|nr:hypothetical protein [Candidatus ainarchaeum sp.]
MLPRVLIVLLLLPALAFAGNDTTQGGNITTVNLAIPQNSSWHGVVGTLSPAPAVPFSINATPGNMTNTVITSGSGSAPYGVNGSIWLLFSNSSTQITSLSPGSLASLDQFIGAIGQNASSTFTANTTFIIGNFTIANVPTAYTLAPVPTTFRMGYLRDQNGNIVIAVQAVNRSSGFNGSLFDFQLMLPTQNGTAVEYYLTVIVKGNLPPNPPPPPPPPGPSQGGGGSHTPYYNETRNATPVNITNITNVTCIAEIWCGEWGACVDGFRYQSCTDLANCSGIEIFRSERCGVPPGGIEPEVPPGKLIPIVLEREFPCLIYLLLLILLLLMLFYLWRRGKKEREKQAASTR